MRHGGRWHGGCPAARPGRPTSRGRAEPTLLARLRAVPTRLRDGAGRAARRPHPVDGRTVRLAWPRDVPAPAVATVVRRSAGVTLAGALLLLPAAVRDGRRPGVLPCSTAASGWPSWSRFSWRTAAQAAGAVVVGPIRRLWTSRTRLRRTAMLNNPITAALTRPGTSRKTSRGSCRPRRGRDRGT